MEYKIGDKIITENTFDRAIRYIDPIRANKRFQARAISAVVGGYTGADYSRRSLSQWLPFLSKNTSVDKETVRDLPTLRSASRDLVRNAPIAGGAINTVCTNTVGTGLKLHARVDKDILGISEEQADALELIIKREWNLYANSKECDAARTLNFVDMQDVAFRSTLESGDIFALMPHIKRSGSVYNLKIQLIEADRICNKDYKPDTDTLIAGIQKDEYGAPKEYHIANQHPGNAYYNYKKNLTWSVVPAFGKASGRRNVLHLYQTMRPGQTRGIVYLAGVIEPLKQLDRFTEAELQAAVISSMFTIFVKTEQGDESLSPMSPAGETGGTSTDEDYKIASGAIVMLGKNQEIQTANPTRPNSTFDPFVTLILRQIGVYLEIPYELLIKSFMASYSASRAALLEAWKFFITQRQWLADNFCQPVYESWFEEAVLLGRIPAPGFFDDPIIRNAYLGAEWVGPSKGMINEKDEATAAQLRLDMGITTLEEETAALTGGDWERKHQQSVKERRMRKEGGLIAEAPQQMQPDNNKEDDKNKDKEKDNPDDKEDNPDDEEDNQDKEETEK